MEEVATRKIVDPTTKEDVEAREEDTTKLSEEEKAIGVDKDTTVESRTSLNTPNDDNFIYNVEPEMGVKLKYTHPVTTGVKPLISPDNNQGKITKGKNLENNKGTTNFNTRDLTKNNPLNKTKGEMNKNNTSSKGEAIQDSKIASKENQENTRRKKGRRKNN